MAKTYKLMLLTILLTGSIVISCFGQKRTDWQKNNLKGRVKSLTKTEYDATEKFGEPIKGGIKDKTETTTIQFDSNGKIIQPEKGGNTVYKYDTRGNKIEETTYDSDNSTILSKSVFKYDLNDNVLEAVNYNSEGRQTSKEINTYDLNGNLLESKNNSGQFNGTINQGQELISKYKYDSYGRLIGYSVSIGDGELASATFKNDANGDVIESNTETFEGYNAKKTYKYTYDAVGNWITKVSYSSSAYMNMKAESKADAIIERVIEYFKDPAQLEKEYNELIVKADSSFNSRHYSEAIDYYKQSLEINNEPSIKEQIATAQKLQIEHYQKQISDADFSFNEKNYTAALEKYKKALDIKDEQYPKEKINETQAKIAEERARKEKIEAAIKKGNNFFETKKYKEALAEYNSANAIETSNEVTEKIKTTQKEIERIDGLQKQRLETYSYLKTHSETIAIEMTNLKVSLENNKKVYGKNYELCMNLLNSKFPSYFSSINALFSSNKTTGLKMEDSWNEIDQDALDMLTKFKEEFKQYEKFHNAVMSAFVSDNKDELKKLKSSDDPKEIISQF